MPLISISPSVTLWKRSSSLMIVVFPAPFSPTKAIFSPLLIFTLKSFKINRSVFGYLNETFLNSITAGVGEEERVVGFEGDLITFSVFKKSKNLSRYLVLVSMLEY